MENDGNGMAYEFFEGMGRKLVEVLVEMMRKWGGIVEMVGNDGNVVAPP